MSETNGTRFIDKLIAASPTERRKFSVLGQDIYFTPLTRKAMRDAIPDDGVQRAPDYAGLFVMVHCAENEDGSKVFRKDDIELLRTRVSVELLQQIESAMMATILPSTKEADNLVTTDPPSASA